MAPCTDSQRLGRQLHGTLFAGARTLRRRYTVVPGLSSALSIRALTRAISIYRATSGRTQLPAAAILRESQAISTGMILLTTQEPFLAATPQKTMPPMWRALLAPEVTTM